MRHDLCGRFRTGVSRKLNAIRRDSTCTAAQNPPVFLIQDRKKHGNEFANSTASQFPRRVTGTGYFAGNPGEWKLFDEVPQVSMVLRAPNLRIPIGFILYCAARRLQVTSSAGETNI